MYSELGNVDAEAPITVYTPGGKDPETGETLVIPHVAQLPQGKKMLLFLGAWFQTFEGRDPLSYLRCVKEEWGVGVLDDAGVVRGGVFDGKDSSEIGAAIDDASEAISPSALFRDSDLVVEATVGEQGSRTVNDVQYMETCLRVARVLKGNGKKVIKVLSEKDLSKVGWDKDCRMDEMMGQRIIAFLKSDSVGVRFVRGQYGYAGVAGDRIYMNPFPGYPETRRATGETVEHYVMRMKGGMP
jgi:hypothetical protein